jgi:hypothetical protein
LANLFEFAVLLVLGFNVYTSEFFTALDAITALCAQTQTKKFFKSVALQHF